VHAVFTGIAVTLALALALQGCGADSNGPEEGTNTWTDDIRPILVRHCAGCHGSSGCTIDGTCFLDQYTLMPSPTLQMSDCEGLSFSECSVFSIQIGLMPPGGCLPGQKKCIALDEFELLKKWVENGSPE